MMTLKDIEIPYSQSLEQIKLTVESVTNTNLKEKTRKRNHVDALLIYSSLSRTLTEYSSSVIGSVIGKSHATVLYHVKKCADLLEYDREFNRLYDLCLKSLPPTNIEAQLKHCYDFHLKKARIYRKKMQLLKNLELDD